VIALFGTHVHFIRTTLVQEYFLSLYHETLCLSNDSFRNYFLALFIPDLIIDKPSVYSYGLATKFTHAKVTAL
jgi:hypothetical protein